MPKLEQLVERLYATARSWVDDAVTMIPNLVGAILIVLVGYFASRWMQRAVTQLFTRMSHNAPLAGIMGNVARLTALALAFFAALGVLHLDKTVTSLLAGVGVVGLALGFAFQDIAANFMSGFMMAMRRPFLVGDLVEVGGHRGRVLDITLRATEIETLDGLSVLLPNRQVFQGVIVNYTRTSRRRVQLSVGTAYGDDMTQVREAVSEAVQGVEGRDPERDVEVFFEAFGDSSINFVVHLWLGEADERTFLRARSEAMIAIKRALDDAGLTIPFPIRTLDFGATTVGGTSLEATPVRVLSSARGG